MKTNLNGLTVGACQVSPVKQRAVKGSQRLVEEHVGAVGWATDGVGEQIHLQQGLDQVAQHRAPQRDPQPPLAALLPLSLS